MNPFSALIRPALTGTLALLALALPAAAQIQSQPEVINMNIRSTIDPLGNGVMTLTLRMSAKEWASWKRQYGANPSLFKRDMCKMFTQYELTDFDLTQDEMDREAVVTIKGKALATYESGGAYEVVLDKAMAKGDLVDGEYRVTYTEPQGPNAMSLIDHRVQLPAGASHAEVTTGATGEPVLRYRLPTPGGGLPWSWIGVFAAVAGAALMFASTKVAAPGPRAMAQPATAGTLAS